MKKIFLCFLALLIIVIVFIPTDAHSGGTDANGGHWDHSTGEYHYHHGKPAHQHTNGICPYDDKKESTSKKKNSSNSYYYTSNKSSSNDSEKNHTPLIVIGSALAGVVGTKAIERIKRKR